MNVYFDSRCEFLSICVKMHVHNLNKSKQIKVKFLNGDSLYQYLDWWLFWTRQLTKVSKNIFKKIILWLSIQIYT